MIKTIKRLMKWRKTPYVVNKEDLATLSDAEKGLVEEHRKKMLKSERDSAEMQRVLQNEMDRMMVPSVELENSKIEYLYDFLGGWHSGNNTIVPINGSLTGSGISIDAFGTQLAYNGQMLTSADLPSIPLTVNAGTDNEQVIGRVVAVKPIDVFHELERVPGPEMMKDIDAKIAVFKTKKSLIRDNRYCKDEAIDMVLRLENRKKWDEFKSFYEQFDNTTSDKVQDLVTKYKLVLKSSDLFIAAFPDEAINIMGEYVEQTMKLCGKKPVFYVIAEEQMFEDEFKKKDPILLVQSPFGAYWQILGAWDKEMILLDEL